MTPGQRQDIIGRLEAGEELSPGWAWIMFPPEKREYELPYHGNEREGDMLANTLAVSAPPSRSSIRLRAGPVAFPFNAVNDSTV